MNETDQKLFLGALVLALVALLVISYFIPLQSRKPSGDGLKEIYDHNSSTRNHEGVEHTATKATEMASLWSRIGGALVDLLIVAICSFVIIFCWALLAGLDQQSISASNWEARGFLVGLTVDFLITVIPMCGNKQSTFGQRAVGIKTVMVNGEDIAFVHAFIRYFVSLFSSIMLKLGFAIALFTKNKRTLHDLAAGTIVVKE